jgi:hypothetical protein
VRGALELFLVIVVPAWGDNSHSANFWIQILDRMQIPWEVGRDAKDSSGQGGRSRPTLSRPPELAALVPADAEARWVGWVVRAGPLGARPDGLAHLQISATVRSLPQHVYITLGVENEQVGTAMTPSPGAMVARTWIFQPQQSTTSGSTRGWSIRERTVSLTA